MASERQIAANRQNARRSTGPRTRAGKRRSSGNALTHGLSSIAAGGSAEVEALARCLVGHDADPDRVELARDVARAHLDLLRLREVQSDMLKRVYQFGALQRSPPRHSVADINHVMRGLRLPHVHLPERVNLRGPMPDEEEARVGEAMRRLLPELHRFDRYERQAFRAKLSAMRKLAEALNRRTSIANERGDKF